MAIRSALAQRSVSFEVFADDPKGMRQQALQIASWGSNVFVKIPVINSVGQATTDLIHALSQAGVRVNVTAVFTLLICQHERSAAA